MPTNAPGGLVNSYVVGVGKRKPVKAAVKKVVPPPPVAEPKPVVEEAATDTPVPAA